MYTSPDRAEPAGLLVTTLAHLGTSVSLTLSGAAHRASLRELRAALASVPLTPGRGLELSLAALQSCDDEVAWELLEFVRDVKDLGGRVRLVDDPNPVVAYVLTLADVRGDLAMADVRDGAPTVEG